MAAVIGAAEHYHCATVDDDRLGLHVDHHRRWLARDAAEGWWQTIMREVRWYRVKYKSHRFQNECETPCWTTFYGGSAEFSPFLPVPAWLQPLVADVSERCGGAPFNAMLLRLYFDGADEIAWHTDGRTFLGDAPTIASLSLGATAQFQMRRMTNVWPCGSDDGIDRSAARRDFAVGDGDLLVMRGDTQKHWHHRVPKEKGRRPRINVNFRYILEGAPDAERGQHTYYKYMVHGDSAMPGGADAAPSWSYAELLRRRGSLLSFVAAAPAGPAPAAVAAAAAAPAAADATEGGAAAAAPTDEDGGGDKVETLRDILGPGPSTAEVRSLLARANGDVQRAIEAHFAAAATSAAASAAAAAAPARAPSGGPRGRAPKRAKKGGQRSVLAMFAKKG